MAFDPDAYLNKIGKAQEKSGFDPDAYLAKIGKNVEQDQKADYDYSNIKQVAKDLLKTNIDALPVYGAAAGGAIAGLPTGGLAAAQGAGLGAGLGQSAKDILNHYLFDEEKTTKDTLLDPAVAVVKGAAAEMGGQVLGKGIEGAVKLIPKAGQVAKDAAENLSARVIGAERGTIKKLGSDKVKEIGRYALDNKLYGAFSNTDDVIAANLAKQAEGGRMMDEVYSQIDDAGKSTFSPLETATKVDSELGGFIRDPLNKSMANQFDNTIESILARGDGNIPIKKAQELKEVLGQAANWKNKLVITDKEQIARDAYGIVSKQIDNAVDSGAKAIGSDGLLEILKQGKKLFGNSKSAAELLENKLAREQGNKMIGLTDWGVLGAGGAATAATGGAAALPTMALYGAKKYGEKYGAQQGALALDKISKSLLKSPEMARLAKTSPQIFQSVVQTLAKKSNGEVQILKAAENQDQQQAKKGPEKWIFEGGNKLTEHDNNLDPAVIEQLKKSKRGRDLLMRASDLKPGSKAMDRIAEEIKQQGGE